MPTIKRLLTDETGQDIVQAIEDLSIAIKPNATDIHMSSSDSTSVAQKINSEIATVADGIAIVAEGDIHAAITKDQFVYVRNHSTLAQGVYKATTAIGTNAALSTSNLTLDNAGGLNDLQAQITSLNSNIVNNSVTGSSAVTTTHTIADARLAKLGNLAILTATIDLTANVSAWTSVFNINDVRLQASTYVFADVNNEIKEFYVGADGGVSCTSSLTSGKEIKITIPIAVK